MDSAALLALLARAPVRLAEASAGVPEEQLARRPEPAAWSAAEVLAHLRSCAVVWGDAVHTLLEQDHPTLRARNPRTWIRETDYASVPFLPALEEFTRRRAALLRVLEPLPPQDWERAGTVTGAGRPLELTVRGYVERLAVHERAHVTQVERLLA